LALAGRTKTVDDKNKVKIAVLIKVG